MNAANSAVGSTPASRTTRRRVRRDRANAVAASQPVARERVRERREQLPPRRSVEPGRRGRVAVDVRDHPRRHPRELPSDDRERRLLRALREHGIGPECAQLTRDPERQQRVEGEPVERTWSNRPNERETRIRPAPATRAREHADVELRLERGELLLERRRERQRVARAADHEEPLPHVPARWSSASIVVKTTSSEYLSTEAWCRLGAAARGARRPRRSARLPRPALPDRRVARGARSRRRARPRARHRPPSR